MISNEQYDYLKTHKTFAQLTREAIDQLARHIPFRKIAKGQVIFYALDPSDYFWSTIEMKPHVLRVDSSRFVLRCISCRYFATN